MHYDMVCLEILYLTSPTCIQDALSSRAALGLPAVQPLGLVRRPSKSILHTNPRPKLTKYYTEC